MRNDLSSTSEHPGFAVVIPVYNGRTHLAATLRSVFSQTYTPEEVIVVEDGSPVPSSDIVQEFPGVLYLPQTNTGVSGARNHGAAVARSEWICFLDQDDLLLPHHLEQFAETLRRDASADLLYAPRCVLLERSGEWVTEKTTTPPPPEQLPKSLLDRCPFPPSGVCVRRNVFEESGGFSSRYNLAEDWEFWLRCMQQGRRFAACHEATVCYRVHADSASHRPLPILKANTLVIQERIVPALPRLASLWRRRQLISRQEADAAILLRQTGREGALRLLLRSIVRYPAGDLRRYKIGSHMLLSMILPLASKGERPASTL